jgi:hypothetical protein
MKPKAAVEERVDRALARTSLEAKPTQKPVGLRKKSNA